MKSRRPIFVQGIWQTGSQYVVRQFRDETKYWTFREPHECRITEPNEQTTSKIRPVPHGPPSRGFAGESKDCVEEFEKALGYERYCLQDIERDERLHRYVLNLIEHAEKHDRQAVVQFNRGLLRAAWFQANFSPIQILLLRHPRNIWKSWERAESHQYHAYFCAILGHNQDKYPLKHVPSWLEIPCKLGGTFAEERSFYQAFADKHIHFLYPSFVDFYLVSFVHCAQFADCVLDLDALAINQTAREKAQSRLREMGIEMDFSDCDVLSHATGSADEEMLAYETFSLQYLEKNLPREFGICKKKADAHYPLLGHFFRKAIEAFTDGRLCTVRGAARSTETNKQRHSLAIDLFQDRQFYAAAKILNSAVAQEATGELWNDWATAQSACGRPHLAELGFRMALRSDPAFSDAGGNLGALLLRQDRAREALPLLEEAELRASGQMRPVVSSLVNKARALLGFCASIAEPAPSQSKEPVVFLESSQEIIDVAPIGEAKKQIGTSFYRGDTCNFNPYGGDHQRNNFCEYYIFKGLLPAAKIINKDTKVTAFGSCFATHITQYLANLGFRTLRDRAPGIYISSMGEGLVHVYALLQQFEWALTNVRPPENLWHGFDAQSFGYDEDVRRRTREVLLTTEVFIITLGLSEIWFDEPTGGIFWRAVPLKFYDASRHKFRVCSFAETKEAIAKIYRLIRSEIPAARIVFTLSPIPLTATFRNQGCIVANSASKSILRAALDEFFRTTANPTERDLYYFPAFEIVNELFPSRFIEDGRHLHPFIVPAIMKLFESHYCDTGLTVAEAEASLKLARKTSASLCDKESRYSRNHLDRQTGNELNTSLRETE